MQTGQLDIETGHRTPGQPRARALPTEGMSGLSGRTNTADSGQGQESCPDTDTRLEGGRPSPAGNAKREDQDTDTPHCFDCAAARRDYLHASYVMGCPECRARMVSRSPQYQASEARNVVTTEYRALLETVGAGHWMDAHRMCKAWAEITADLKSSARYADDKATQRMTAAG